MKNAYPVILTPDEVGYIVYVPDFDTNTQGEDLYDAIEMARDVIGLVGVTKEDNGEPLPQPSSLSEHTVKDGEILTLVDIDFAEYRRQIDNMSVKKNCTLPGWLCYKAEKANINFSQVLQKALKQELHITDR